MKISDLPAAAQLTNDDFFVIVDNAGNKQTQKLTAYQLLSYVQSGFGQSNAFIFQYDNVTLFPTPGISNAIYVDKENYNLYVWDEGSAYSPYKLTTPWDHPARIINLDKGGTGATDSTTARTNLGLDIGTNVQAYSVILGSISGGIYSGSASTTTLGTIASGTWNGATIAVANGGTNATDAATARTNLGVRIGTDVQAYSALLGSIANGSYDLPSSNSSSLGTVTSGTWNAATITIAYGGTSATDTLAARTNLGMAIGTNVQAYSALLGSVSGGTYSGTTSTTTVGTITSGTWTGANIAVAYGGTGATDATVARTNLGIRIGTDIQAYSALLGSVAGGTYYGTTSTTTVGTITSGTWNGAAIAVANGGTGAADATVARTNLGIRIGTDVQAYSSLLGSIANGSYSLPSSNSSSLGTVTSGLWNATTIAIAHGGTDATDAISARTNLGVAIGTNVQAYSALLGSISSGTYSGTTNTIIVGTITSGTWNGDAIAVTNGGTSATDATTARTNLGIRIGTDVQAYSNLLESVSGGTYSGSVSINTVGTITSGTWSGTTIAVINGGTSATDATTARTNLGVRIGTDVQAYSSLLGSIANGSYNISSSSSNSSSLSIGNISISGNEISSTNNNLIINPYNGKFSITNGNFSKNIYLLKATTNNNATTPLTTDGNAVSENNVLIINNNKTIWNYEIKISAYSDTTDEGCIFNIKGAAQKTISNASILPDNIQEEWKSISLENCFISTSINTINTKKYLNISVTGTNLANIQWFAVAEISEMYFV